MTETEHGFIPGDRGYIAPMGAERRSYLHASTGLTVLFLENDDDNRSFSAAVRVPQEDDSDAAHVLEHTLTASSRNYRSRDIFFDMEGKTCNTFLNAETYPAVTIYQLASRSMEQLYGMMDVYLDCLAHPSFTEDPRYFLREGFRAEYREDGEGITAEPAGVVFSEDMGYLTDTERTVWSAVMENLYRGSAAAHNIGRCYLHPERLTCDRVRDTYERFYHPRNMMIILYGAWEKERVLRRLDAFAREMGTREKRPGENALDCCRAAAVPGFKRLTVETPAYAGDDTEEASVIVWARDLADFGQDDCIALAALCDILNEDSSVFQEMLKKQGLHRKADWEIDAGDGYAANTLSVWLTDCEPGEEEALSAAVRETLAHVAEHGVDPELFRIVSKGVRLADSLTRNHGNLGISVSEVLATSWAVTGKTDLYERTQEVWERLRGEDGMSVLRSAAGRLLLPGASVLITGVPKEGLAEEIEDAVSGRLSREAAGMTPAELRRHLEETAAYDRWNEDALSCDSFMVPVSELPPYRAFPAVRQREKDGMFFLSADSGMREAGSFGIGFHAGRVGPESLYDLNLAIMLLGETDTLHHDRARVSARMSEYLNNFYMDTIFPGEDAGAFHHPILHVSWTGLAGDFPEALSLVLELLRSSRFDVGSQVADSIGKYREDYNKAKSEPLSEARDLADTAISLSAGYRYLADGPDFYRYLLREERKLAEDPAYGGVLAERLSAVLRLASGTEGAVIMTAAGTEEIPCIEAEAERILGECGKIPGTETGAPNSGDEERQRDFIRRSASLNAPGSRSAIVMEASMQSFSWRADLRRVPGFSGRYLPFWCALSARYLVPAFRFRNGAYSGGLSFYLLKGMLEVTSVSDPTVREAFAVLRGMPEELRKMQLTRRDLDGCIMQAAGMAAPPTGRLDMAVYAMQMRVSGISPEQVEKTVREIGEAELSDLAAAADFLEKLLERGAAVIAGNGARILPEREFFDQVLDYREE